VGVDNSVIDMTDNELVSNVGTTARFGIGTEIGGKMSELRLARLRFESICRCVFSLCFWDGGTVWR